MDIQVAQILALTIYKIVSLLAGVSLSYMGYRLFMAGIWGHAGDAEGEFGNNRIVIKKAAPGTFFVLMGAIVIGLTLVKGLNFEISPVMEGALSEKPALID
uniref:hypothetical protein n=1 Tax=Marinobacterium profundum TaxID=1714300 RepID=UPI00082C6572|nr:hypothetical protein [Marinobacterium profundum]